ncbi:MAG: hypothetical protein JKY22_12285 [Flavobacteriaceae bacterium]|nr:hypothetical protein [Flavobacteriaceae bacterium]
MSSVVEIEEAMPHFMIIGHTGITHIIPVGAVKKMANGKNKLINKGQEDVDIDLIQGIIREWLEMKGEL